MELPQINLQDYNYDLPDDRIAKHPLPNRDASKLLVYRNGRILHWVFKDIPGLLPENALLVFNNTRVIRARLLFHRPTGAKIEIFCHEPADMQENISILLNHKQEVLWKCLVGNKDKWRKHRETLSLETELDGILQQLYCDFIDDDKDMTLVKFSWTGNYSFYEILEYFGSTPIPPYLHRAATTTDVSAYQTVYARENGAVAAPTAGLHFTEDILSKIRKKGIVEASVTLHVSSGTFKPIKQNNIIDHPMHCEQMVISKEFVETLLEHQGPAVCVGTTSVRSLESLYWFGVQLIKSPETDCFTIEKLYPYLQTDKNTISVKEALNAVLGFMNRKKVNVLIGDTSIFIFPPYKFHLCDILITNFHMPMSTLILLVSAFTENNWMKIYNEALEKDYRFLSYGDSSILFRS